MSEAKIISRIKKQQQRKKVFSFVKEELRRGEDLADNAAAEHALVEPGKSIPWTQARENLGWA